MIFTWFGNPRLRPRLQAHPAWGFHYPNLPSLQVLYNWLPMCQWTFTIKRLSLQSLHSKCLSHLYTHNLIRNKNYNKQLFFIVDIQTIAQLKFNLWWLAKLKLNICCVHLFMLAKIAKNELDLSLYSLSPKTSRYKLSGDNRLAALWIRLAVFIYRYNKYLNFRTFGMPLSESD